MRTAIELGKEGVTWVEDSPHAVPCRLVSSQQAVGPQFCPGNLGDPRLIDIGSNLRLSDLASKVKQVTAWVNLRKSQQKRSVTECGLWGPVT